MCFHTQRSPLRNSMTSPRCVNQLKNSSKKMVDISVKALSLEAMFTGNFEVTNCTVHVCKTNIIAAQDCRNWLSVNCPV